MVGFQTIVLRHCRRVDLGTERHNHPVGGSLGGLAHLGSEVTRQPHSDYHNANSGLHVRGCWIGRRRGSASSSYFGATDETGPSIGYWWLLTGSGIGPPPA